MEKIEEVKVLKGIAKDNYELDQHTWTKGEEYEIHIKPYSVMITSNEAQLSWVKERESSILAMFEDIREEK